MLSETAADSLAVLSDETKTAMRLLGVQSLDQLGMQHVSIFPGPVALECVAYSLQINARLVEQQIFDGPDGLGACRAAHLSKL